MNSEPALALFDPTSLHNRFRASARSENKMRGFFHWLHLQQMQAEKRRTRQLAGHAAAEEGRGEMLPDVAVLPPETERRLVLWAEHPETPVAATLTVLRHKQDGPETITLSLQLPNQADFPPGPVRCRAYFLEPPVVNRLKKAAVEEGGSSCLRDVFRDEMVVRSLEVARVLAAVAELEGTINQDGAGSFQSFALPDSCAAVVLPEEVTIVVVIDRYPKKGA
jgi:hypothetical protein